MNPSASNPASPVIEVRCVRPERITSVFCEHVYAVALHPSTDASDVDAVLGSFPHPLVVVRSDQDQASADFGQFVRRAAANRSAEESAEAFVPSGSDDSHAACLERRSASLAAPRRSSDCVSVASSIAFLPFRSELLAG